MRPFRVCGTLEGRSAFRALFTALPGGLYPDEAPVTPALRRLAVGTLRRRPRKSAPLGSVGS